jgi:hypothetical protein
MPGVEVLRPACEGACCSQHTLEIARKIALLDSRVKIAGERGEVERGQHGLPLDAPVTVAIERHLDTIETVDHILDLGKESDHRAGRPMASGTPEQVAAREPPRTGKPSAALLRPHG